MSTGITDNALTPDPTFTSTGTVQNPTGITAGYIANPGGAANTTTGSATQAGAAAVNAASNPSTITDVFSSISNWVTNFFSAANATRWASVGIGGAFVIIAVIALIASNKQVQEIVKTGAAAVA